MKKDEAVLTGAQCQFARNKLGLTQAQLAKQVGVSRSQIANFETKGERFTPSTEVRQKLRAFFEEQDPQITREFGTLDGDEQDATPKDMGSPIGSREMQYVRRLTDFGCFRMTAELSEGQRDRLLDEIDKTRDALEDLASTPAKPGFFDAYDQGTDERIAQADALIKKFGFLCIVAFGYGFVTLPTTSLMDGKRKPLGQGHEPQTPPRRRAHSAPRVAHRP